MKIIWLILKATTEKDDIVFLYIIGYYISVFFCIGVRDGECHSLMLRNGRIKVVCFMPGCWWFCRPVVLNLSTHSYPL